MDSGSVIHFILIFSTLYLIYKLFWGSKFRSKGAAECQFISNMHWPRGRLVEVHDNGAYTNNLTRVAANTYGESANKIGIAFLIPEETTIEKSPQISVIVDGLKIGVLSGWDAANMLDILKQQNLDFMITSCDLYIRGGGTGLDGKSLAIRSF